MRASTSLRLGAITTALITPFRDDKLDFAALEHLAERQIRSAIDDLAVCTVTGEGPTLTMEERAAVVRTCVRVAAGRVPFIAATGTSSTSSTVALTREAEDLGASAALVTLPYYSKPGHRGVVHHFETLAAATTLPLIADSNPSRCAIGLSQETLETFSSIPSIVGLVGILGNGCSLNALAPHLRDRFTFLSNRDDTAVAFLSQSGDGIISAGANVHPRLFASMQQAARGGNICAALALEERLLPLMQALGVQGNPSAIKHAVHSGGNFSVHSKGKSMPSLHSRAPIAPLKREASVRFTIGQDKTGRWVVQDRDGRVGGIFTSEQAARHFAADECGHDAAQIAHARDGLVLQFTPLDGDSGSIH